MYGKSYILSVKYLPTPISSNSLWSIIIYEAGKDLLFVHLELTNKPTAPHACESRICALANIPLLLHVISLVISGPTSCHNPQCIEVKDYNLKVEPLSDSYYLINRPHNHLWSDKRIHTWHITHERFSVYYGLYDGTPYLSQCIRDMLHSHNVDDTNNLSRTFECQHPNGDPSQPALDRKWILVRQFPSPVGVCYERTNGTWYYQYKIRVIVGSTRGGADWQIISHHPYS